MANQKKTNGEAGRTDSQAALHERRAAERKAAADELLRERERDEKALEEAFQERVEEKFEDPDRALRAYEDNFESIEEDGGDPQKAREIMIRPDRYQNELGGPSDDSLTDPGEVSDDYQGAQAMETQSELWDIAEELDTLRKETRHLENEVSDISDEVVEEGRRGMSATKIADTIEEVEKPLIEQRDDGRNAAERKKHIDEISDQKDEPQRLEKQQDRLEEVVDLNSDTFRERVQEARDEANRAKKELIEDLKRVYQNPEEAADRFQEQARQEGFESAIETLTHEPDQVGTEDQDPLELQKGATMDWKTKALVDRPGGRSAADMYAKAPDSTARKAANWTLKEAHRAELDLQNAVKRTGATRKQIYNQGTEEQKERVDQAAEVLGRAKREHQKVKRRLENRRGEEETEEDDRQLQKSAALTYKKREEEFERVLNHMYKNPDVARARIEEEAFAEGTDISSGSFQEAAKKMYENPGEFGDIDLKGMREFANRGTKQAQMGARTRIRVYKEVAEEFGEYAVEEGPDEATEEAVSKVRQMVQIGAFSVAGTIGEGYRTHQEAQAFHETKEKARNRMMNLGASLDKYKRQREAGDEEMVQVRMPMRYKTMESRDTSRQASEGEEEEQEVTEDEEVAPHTDEEVAPHTAAQYEREAPPESEVIPSGSSSPEREQSESAEKSSRQKKTAEPVEGDSPENDPRQNTSNQRVGNSERSQGPEEAKSPIEEEAEKAARRRERARQKADDHVGSEPGDQEVTAEKYEEIRDLEQGEKEIGEMNERVEDLMDRLEDQATKDALEQSEDLDFSRQETRSEGREQQVSQASRPGSTQGAHTENASQKVGTSTTEGSANDKSADKERDTPSYDRGGRGF